MVPAPRTWVVSNRGVGYVGRWEERCSLLSNLLETVTLNDPHPDKGRYVTIGLDFLGRVLVVSWTWRDEEVRLISARRATRKESRDYEEE